MAWLQCGQLVRELKELESRMALKLCWCSSVCRGDDSMWSSGIRLPKLHVMLLVDSSTIEGSKTERETESLKLTRSTSSSTTLGLPAIEAWCERRPQNGCCDDSTVKHMNCKRLLANSESDRACSRNKFSSIWARSLVSWKHAISSWPTALRVL